FTSPDRQNAGSDIRIPQSWNGYAYVMNDPLNFTDPNGLIWLRRNGTDSYTWVDDDVYKKNKGDYKDYTPANNAVIRVTGGREA
ncbi:hypothetical protein OFC38_33740, partial [Escherichia coli]|nr:hypothetical protein [Escherichia coli]